MLLSSSNTTNTDASILVYKFRPKSTGFNMSAEYTQPQLTFQILIQMLIQILIQILMQDLIQILLQILIHILIQILKNKSLEN